MAKFSAYLSENILKKVFLGVNFQLTGEFHLALFIGDPEGLGIEISEIGYARQPILWQLSNSYTVTNPEAIFFGEAQNDWPAVSHWAIFDAATDGQLLALGGLVDEFDSPITKSFLAGDVPRFRAFSLEVAFNG